jgi:mRNA interferase MazF
MLNLKLNDYLDWVKHKFFLTSEERDAQVNEGEVYWCALGLNVGDEENGKGIDYRRPILVFKKFNRNIFWGIPLSTKNKDNKYYVSVVLKNEEVSTIISQLRIIDVKRLDVKIGYIGLEDLWKVRKKVKDLIPELPNEYKNKEWAK